jgi:hypothetical protein
MRQLSSPAESQGEVCSMKVVAQNLICVKYFDTVVIGRGLFKCNIPFPVATGKKLGKPQSRLRTKIETECTYPAFRM